MDEKMKTIMGHLKEVERELAYLYKREREHLIEKDGLNGRIEWLEEKYIQSKGVLSDSLRSMIHSFNGDWVKIEWSRADDWVIAVQKVEAERDELLEENQKLKQRLELTQGWLEEAGKELEELRSDYINLLEKVKTHEE